MPNPLRRDPSRTITLRRQFITDLKKRFNLLKKDIRELLVDLDALGLDESNPMLFNAERQVWRFRTDEQKLKEFNSWFSSQVDKRILSVDVKGDPWTAKYTESAYKKGALRAYTDVRKEALAEKVDFYEGTKEEFLRSAFGGPEATQKIRLLYTRTFEELRGVSSAMAQQMSRILADGLSHGLGPYAIARNMFDSIDSLTRARANTIARTETIRAHAEGQLDAFEELGIEEVGVMAEWSTAGDDLVCFPAWTLIETEDEQIPIQHKCSVVKTRHGMNPVIKEMSREYFGDMVILNTERGSIVCTADHPIYASSPLGFDWVQAKDVWPGEAVVSSDNKSVEVLERYRFPLKSDGGVLSVLEKLGICFTVLCMIQFYFGSFKQSIYSFLKCWNLIYSIFRGECIVYNKEVAFNPEYYADGILVHNCPLCGALEGTVMTVAEARGLIPRHANCRCTWLPASVGEK